MWTYTNPCANIVVIYLESYKVLLCDVQSCCKQQIDGLVQERRNSSALAVELRLSCINPSKCHSVKYIHLYIIFQWEIRPLVSIYHQNLMTFDSKVKAVNLWLGMVRRLLCHLTNLVLLNLIFSNINLCLFFLSFLNRRVGTGSSNPSSWKTRFSLSCIVSTMAADDLVTRGSRSSVVMVLT